MYTHIHKHKYLRRRLLSGCMIHLHDDAPNHLILCRVHVRVTCPAYPAAQKKRQTVHLSTNMYAMLLGGIARKFFSQTIHLGTLWEHGYGCFLKTAPCSKCTQLRWWSWGPQTRDAHIWPSFHTGTSTSSVGTHAWCTNPIRYVKPLNMQHTARMHTMKDTREIFYLARFWQEARWKYSLGILWRMPVNAAIGPSTSTCPDLLFWNDSLAVLRGWCADPMHEWQGCICLCRAS